MAISTDTGCFVYANTTADTHRIAAELLETGIDVGPVNKVLFRTKSKTRLAMEARMVADMELYDGDRVVVMSIPLSLRQELHATEADIEELSSLAALVEGTDCGITLRELKPGRVKLSLRTRTAGGRLRRVPKTGRRRPYGCRRRNRGRHAGGRESLDIKGLPRRGGVSHGGRDHHHRQARRLDQHGRVRQAAGHFENEKVGHAGTLDPMATGVLPVFVGSATKGGELCRERRQGSTSPGCGWA